VSILPSFIVNNPTGPSFNTGKQVPCGTTLLRVNEGWLEGGNVDFLGLLDLQPTERRGKLLFRLHSLYLVPVHYNTRHRLTEAVDRTNFSEPGSQLMSYHHYLRKARRSSVSINQRKQLTCQYLSNATLLHKAVLNARGITTAIEGPAVACRPVG
jgi:hypothetical protein